MIAGIGTDLVELARVRDALSRHGDRFVVVADATLAAQLQSRQLVLHISVSDSREHALAYAVAEQLPGADTR